MFDEQMNELRNSITAALIEEPLKVASQAIDDAFDEAFGEDGSYSELRDLLDCYCPFYEDVGTWVDDYWRIHVFWQANLSSEVEYPHTYALGETDNCMTLYGWLRRDAERAIYWAIDMLVRVHYHLGECDLDQEQLAAYEAALFHLKKKWDIYDPNWETA